jgi:hypothetical protein
MSCTEVDQLPFTFNVGNMNLRFCRNCEAAHIIDHRCAGLMAGQSVAEFTELARWFPEH